MTRLTLQQARQLGIIPEAKKKTPKMQLVSKAQWDVWREGDAVVFIIPENMPSLNVWKRWHWAKQQEFLKDLTQSFTVLAIKDKVKQFDKARVVIRHYHRVKRRRDEDNACPKFLLDALRYANVLKDDNSEVLRLEPPVFAIDRVAWRTEVWIYQD